MVTRGNATSAAVKQSIANLGTNILQIYPSGGLRRGGGGSRPPNFKPADVTAIGQQVAGVTGVAPQAQTSATVIRDGHNWSTTTFGMDDEDRSEEHTSELQSLMRISYAVFCLRKHRQRLHTDHILHAAWANLLGQLFFL